MSRVMSKMIARKRLIERKVHGAIDPEQPWRYNPALDEEDQWDIVERYEAFSSSLEKEKYFPGNKELPKEGGWVWVLRPPYTDIKLEFGGLYFAKPYLDAVKGWREMKYSVSVFAPEGQVRLWPYEYSFPNTTEMIEYWSEGAFEFHPFEEEIVQQELTERLFYITSKGIAMTDALPMALGEITRPVGWFEMKS